MVFDGGAQRIQRAEDPALLLPDHPRLSPDHRLPLAPVVGLAPEHDLLDAVAELDIDPLGQKATLVGSGCPGEVRLHELTERGRGGGGVAEGLQQRGKELLGRVGSTIEHARSSLLHEKVREKVQDRCPRSGRKASGLGQRRDRCHRQVLHGLEVAELFQRPERSPVTEEPEPVRLTPRPRASRARLDPDPPAIRESELGPAEPVGLIPACDGQQRSVAIELDDTTRRPVGGTSSRADDGAVAPQADEPAPVIRRAQAGSDRRGRLGILARHSGIREPIEEAVAERRPHG